MTELPRWSVRLNAVRQITDYGDLLSIVSHHYRAYASAENFLAPYNARQRAKSFYTPPSREELKSAVKQGGMNDVSYFAMIGGFIKWCEDTKGNMALPTPHPSTIHSIQIPEPAFEIAPVTKKGMMVTHQLSIPSAAPIFLNGVRNPESIKFVIVRPKLSKLGTPSVKDWEALLFTKNHGFIPQWVDSNLNPRWSGIF